MALVEGCKHTLEITVPAEEVEAETGRAVAKVQQRAKLPGFRPGKAPASIIRKQFAGDIRKQVLESLIPKYLHKQFEAEDLKVVGTARYHRRSLRGRRAAALQGRVRSGAADRAAGLQGPRRCRITIRKSPTRTSHKRIEELRASEGRVRERGSAAARRTAISRCCRSKASAAWRVRRSSRTR